MDFDNITIKSHPRARSVKIKASVRHGIEVVVPLRFNKKLLPEILEKNKTWIEKRLAEIQATLKKAEAEAFPEQLNLLAINQSWKIVYLKTDNTKLRLMTRPGNEVVLLGNCDNKTLCKKLLKQWLKLHAKKFLIPLLKTVSDEIKLPFKSANIRAQHTRWGSCSSDKSISLNYKLLFLPVPLARHILIHELAHTVHLNHSSKFWRMVAQFDPNWKAHNALIRKADSMMPGWFI
jgi:predicted metal-dependent hydrolase